MLSLRCGLNIDEWVEGGDEWVVSSGGQESTSSLRCGLWNDV